MRTIIFFNLLIMMFEEKKKIFIKWTKQLKITAYTIQDKKMVSRYTCTNNLSCLSEKIIIDIKIYIIMFFNRKNKLEGLCKKKMTENSP